jgi:hypothetical protein
MSYLSGIGRKRLPHKSTKVGRTPPSAPDPLVRLFLCSSRPTRGSTAGQGARPTKVGQTLPSVDPIVRQASGVAVS